MRVDDRVSQMIGIFAHVTSKRPLEYMTLNTKRPLNEQRSASHDWLHHPAERSHALPKNDVKVIWHDRVSEKNSIRRRDAPSDVARDRFSQRVLEKRRARLRARCYMEGCPWQMQSKCASHAQDDCTARWA